MSDQLQDVARQIATIGRYAVFGEIARGSVATVHYGRLLGAAGVARTVAIKRFGRDAHFAGSLVDEARLAARIRHANVVATLDVEVEGGEVALVMEYIAGETLAKLVRARAVPVPIASGILAGALHGLHAAHETKNDRGNAVDLIHRDVSPQNILVGADGIARVADFGIAKAIGKTQTARAGKARYLAPEQALLYELTPRTDVYAAGAVLWEILSGRRLINGADPLQTIIEAKFEPPSRHAAGISDRLDAIVMKALSANAKLRFESARAFAIALEEEVGIATPRQIEAWVLANAGGELERRAAEVAVIEATTSPPARMTPKRVPAPERAAAAEDTISEVRTGDLDPSPPTMMELAPDLDRMMSAVPTPAEFEEAKPTVVDAPPTMLSIAGEDDHPTRLSVGPAADAAVRSSGDTILEISTIKPPRPRSPTPPTPPPPARGSAPSAKASRAIGPSPTQPIVAQLHADAPTLVPRAARPIAASPPPPKSEAEATPAPAPAPAPELAPQNESTTTFESLYAGTRAPQRRARIALLAVLTAVLAGALVALLDRAPPNAAPAPDPAATPSATPAPPASETSTRAGKTQRPKAECDPPHLIDEAGIQRIKPECL